MSAVVVGVDVGTSGARAHAIDDKGIIVASAAVSYGHSDRAARGCVDALIWYSATLEVLDAVVGKLPSRARLLAACFGGQSPTTIDARSRRAITVDHPAGAEGNPVDHHLAQREVLEADGYDVQPRQLWDWLVEKFGGLASQGRWPGDPTLPGYGDLRTTGEVLGRGVPSAGPLANVTLVAGAQDAYLAAWTAGVVRPGRAVDPGGRTGGLAVAVAKGVRVPSMWAAASAAAGVDVVGGPVSAHGEAVEWLAGLLDRPIPEVLALAATAPPGAGGLLFLPYLNGERAPRWDRNLRGLIAGIDTRTTAPALARAVLEGAAYGLGHIAQVLRRSGVALDTLVCGGGPARSRLWCEIKAAVLNVPVLVPRTADLAAYGAALAAGAGIGWWPRPGAGVAGDWPSPPMSEIRPHPRPEYREQLERFIALGDVIQSAWRRPDSSAETREPPSHGDDITAARGRTSR